MNNKISHLLVQALSLILLLLATSPAFGQSAPISYRGLLTASGIPANSPHDMEFKMFDTAAIGSGVQKGDMIPKPAVPVANGVFTVTLDFGAAGFDGSPRFLEISVKPGGSASPYTILAPRQQVASIPYAIRSLSADKAATAATALTVASGSVVKSLNTLKDNVTLAAGPNTTLTQTGNTLTIDAKPSGGGGGSSLWSLAGTDAYYNAGNVGIGTSSPTVGYRLDVIGATRLSPGNGTVQFGSPNAELGLSITPTVGNRADLRFDGSILKLVAATGVVPPSAANGLAITTDGNVGIGISPPTAGYRLDVIGAARLSPGNGTVQFGSPNAELGLSITPTAGNRADLRFDGSVLKLVATAGVAPPTAVNGIAITTAGNVGIGTTAPVTKLHVETSLAGLDAVYGNATGTSGRGVVGNAAGSGAGVYGRSATGSAMHAEGNATQSRDKGGFVKAMIYVDNNGTILRCYDGTTGRSSGDCRFVITKPGGDVGIYRINFGFKIDDRFISITAHKGGGNAAGYNYGANFIFVDATTVDVLTFDADEGDDTHSNAFMIFVF